MSSTRSRPAPASPRHQQALRVVGADRSGRAQLPRRGPRDRRRRPARDRARAVAPRRARPAMPGPGAPAGLPSPSRALASCSSAPPEGGGDGGWGRRTPSLRGHAPTQPGTGRRAATPPSRSTDSPDHLEQPAPVGQLDGFGDDAPVPSVARTSPPPTSEPRSMSIDAETGVSGETVAHQGAVAGLEDVQRHGRRTGKSTVDSGNMGRRVPVMLHHGTGQLGVRGARARALIAQAGPMTSCRRSREGPAFSAGPSLAM